MYDRFMTMHGFDGGLAKEKYCVMGPKIDQSVNYVTECMHKIAAVRGV